MGQERAICRVAVSNLGTGICRLSAMQELQAQKSRLAAA